MKRVVSLALAFVILSGIVLTGAGCGEKPVTLGIVALSVTAVSNLSQAVAPVAQALAASLKREVIPRVYMSEGQLIEALGNGQCDTAIISPFAYAVAHDQYGANVVLSGLHGTSSELRYELLTRPDTGILVPAYLTGVRVGIPAAEGTSEQQYLMTFLKRFSAGDKVTSLGDDQAALGALLAGTVDVAAVSYGYRDQVRLTVPTIDTRIQVVWISERIPFEAVAVAKEPKASPTDIVKAWQDIAGQDAFKPALRTLFGVDGFIPAVDADYAPAREAVQTLGMKIR